ncbi:MAG: ribonuclease HI [Candidatus Baldrarchaeota archaeon]
MIVVFFDGLSEPTNPGIGAYGFVVYIDSKKVKEGYGALGVDVTNNQAEYTAVIKALEWLIDEELTRGKIVVKGDSQLVIRQLNGRYKVKASKILPLFEKAKSLIREFDDISLVWVPREENSEADFLSRKAYKEYVTANPDALKKYKQFLATEKQKQLMDKLNIKYPFYISKREASKLISQKLKQKRRV